MSYSLGQIDASNEDLKPPDMAALQLDTTVEGILRDAATGTLKGGKLSKLIELMTLHTGIG